MKLKNLLQLLLLGAIWGSSYLFVRMAVPLIGIPMTLGLRLTIAAVVMMVFFAFLKNLPKYRSFWKQYLILGVFNLLVPFALTSFAITQLNASIGAILNASTPLFVMVISSVWLHEKTSVKKIIGLLVGVSGLVVLVGWIPLALTFKTILAIVCSLLASLSYSMATVYTRVYLKQSDPVKTATGQLSAAAILALPLLVTSSSHTVFSTQMVLVVLTLALLCTALGYALYFHLIASIGAANASLVTLIVPVFSVIWGITFLHEPLTLGILIGLMLMMTSLWLVLSPPVKTTTKAKIIYLNQKQHDNHRIHLAEK